MKKFLISKKILFLLILLSICFSFFPSVSHATLVPCGRSDQGTMCKLCDLIVGIKGLIDYGFVIFVVLALVMIVIAGVVYIVSAGNEGMMESAKGLLKNALIGFAVILGAWLIINVALWLISAKGDLGIGATSWHTFSCN
jgi:hypothetical protein